MQNSIQLCKPCRDDCAVRDLDASRAAGARHVTARCHALGRSGVAPGSFDAVVSGCVAAVHLRIVCAEEGLGGPDDPVLAGLQPGATHAES